MFHSFSVLKLGRGTYPSFHFFFQFYSVVSRDSKVHNFASSFFFFFFNIRSARLAEMPFTDDPCRQPLFVQLSCLRLSYFIHPYILDNKKKRKGADCIFIYQYCFLFLLYNTHSHSHVPYLFKFSESVQIVFCLFDFFYFSR